MRKLKTNLIPTSAEPDYVKILTHDGKAPKWDFLFMGVCRTTSNEILEHTIATLNPNCGACGGDDLFDEHELIFYLPPKGIWKVVALGNMWSKKYWTNCGYEYDAGINWDIVSANKFFDFTCLKEWWIYWKLDNRI